MMRFSLATAAVTVSLCTGLGLGFFNTASAESNQSFDRIERGRYLSVLGDCAGCHTAPAGRPFAGGLALQTPFGTIVAPNITPDRDTGIGNWTDDEFVAALHEGRGHNGTRLYPAMPYPAYTKMTDADVLAMRAYFATVAPVHNMVIANQLPFPLNIRFAMVFWNWLNFTPGRFQANPQKSAEWNRGAYIVEGPGHCGTCHTPKTALGGDKTGTPLTGTTLQGWFAPNITTNPHKGIGGWSKDDLAQYLKTGTNNWTLASGPMAEAVSHSTSQMTDEDITAIATYLKDSGAGDSASKPTPIAANDDAMRAGAAIYKDNCAVCHRDAGEGESHLFPRLAGSALVQSDDPTTLAHVVLQGTRAVATSTRPTAPAMPAFDWRLNDAQVAAVITYIRNSWGNAAPPVSADTIAKQRTFLANQ
jgi:mono/diheme cytochrome c family protein